MLVEITLPSLGDDDDSVTGGKVANLLAEPGDTLHEGDDLLEIITDKAAFVVPSPRKGVLQEWKLAEGDQVQVGQVLCIYEVRA